jgi:hypothetical protein
VPVPTPSGTLPASDAIQRGHLPTREKPHHQHPHHPGDAVYDHDILLVAQQFAERRKLRAHETAHHPEERRDLVRHVPGRGCDADEADNGSIAKLGDGKGEGARLLLTNCSRGSSRIGRVIGEMCSEKERSRQRVTPPEQAARWVDTQAETARRFASRALPPLKPNQPIQKDGA